MEGKTASEAGKNIIVLLLFSIFFSCSFSKKPKVRFLLSLSNESTSVSKYSVGGTVSGLTGTGLILQKNSTDDLPVTADGVFTFGTQLNANEAYAVSVKSNPSSPSQTCTVSNGSGTIAAANITDVTVSCSGLSISYSAASYTYALNTAITPNTPTVSGTITSCTVSPALPAGLSISSTTCSISGTPTANQSAVTYTVTAGNSVLTASANIDITVNAVTAPSGLTYSGTVYVFRANTVITSVTPTVTGTVTSCSASPSLPTGLSINSTTCAISGTPTVNQGSVNYTITASNAGGSTTASISIAVQATVYRVFVTVSAFTGDLKTLGGGGDGAAGADNLCNADANKPATGTYKAILFDSANRSATPLNNWVLYASSTYVRASDAAQVFTTNGASIFTFGSMTASFDSGAVKDYWTGFRGVGFEWQLGLYTCSDWTTSGAGTTGRFGQSNSTSYNSISTGTQHNCNVSKYLLCAEQ